MNKQICSVCGEDRGGMTDIPAEDIICPPCHDVLAFDDDQQEIRDLVQQLYMQCINYGDKFITVENIIFAVSDRHTGDTLSLHEDFDKALTALKK